MTHDVIFENIDTPSGTIGHILLNRPKAHNALSLNMLEQLRDKLIQWQSQDAIKAVLIEGTGDRAFCAGGDIRAVYQFREEVLNGNKPYFQVEYHLNELIYNYPKPYIAILDGIAMGGGLGISIWGSHTVATERLMFAMPETSIGLFPDIGASYFLTRLPNHMGYYLGLTGNAINAYEALQLGLVETVIDHQSIDSFKATLDLDAIEMPTPVVHDTSSELLNHQDEINECFSYKSITEIINALDGGDAWCHQVAETLRSRSPLSLKVTFDYLKLSEGKEFSEVMLLNKKLVSQFLRDDEFFEGIRAAVIDKDKNPKWQHDIDEVDKIDVRAFFMGT
jgi:enoyl-CoA hydratase